MTELYPLKFETVLKEKVWGGKALVTRFNKKPNGSDNNGESWEISAVADNQSVVSNGFLAGNNIEELIEVYMGDLVGDSVYDKFGNEFPLLIKIIEAREDLSVQVHPGNEMARERHNAYGKTEMWYTLESEKGAKMYTGFIEGVTKEKYVKAVDEGSVAGLLNAVEANQGDVFFTPAGKVHAIGAGIVLLEIQQTSDITYRIFDWNRKKTGKENRELHTDLALDAIDFSLTESNKIIIKPEINNTKNLVSCEFFNTNILQFNQIMKKEYYSNDSFIIYVCIEGEFSVNWDASTENVKKGETVLIPAMIKEFTLVPNGETKAIEVFIESEPSY